MNKKNNKLQPFLILMIGFLCFLFGYFLSGSSSRHLVPGEYDSSKVLAQIEQTPDAEATLTASVTPELKTVTDTPTPIPTPVPTSIPMKEEKYVSPEAELGKWVPVEDKWTFVVKNKPFTGWLHDKDGHVYFLDPDGSMHTGWLNQGGNRYYMDEDGILQTGTEEIEGKIYLFAQDGSIQGYAAPTPTPLPEPTPTPEPVKRAQALPNGQKPAVALTFDDGPGIYANRILDCLEKYNAKATFFMVGNLIPAYPEQVKRMEALGMELGNHSYEHANLSKLTDEDITKQIDTTDLEINRLTGHNSTVVRPPYGALSDASTSAIKVPIILWSIDTLDWETKDPKNTVTVTMNEVKDGSIILMHEIYEQSAVAAEALVPALINAGYDLLTVSELAERHKVTMKTGIPYGNFSYK